MSVAEYTSFSFGDAEQPSLDFFGLREKGISYLQHLSGKDWTDFNSHDPGVTILEQLCYALTDVSLRSSLNINDILATGNKGRIDPRKNGFYAPSEIYQTHPVTELDTKKVLLDHFGDIQNLWIHYTDNSGLVEKKILTQEIEILPKTIFHKRVNLDVLKKNIATYVAQHRNLGEDVEKISLLRPRPVVLGLEIHLHSEDDLEMVLAKLLLDLFEYVYSPVKKYNFEEMSADDEAFAIFSGPRLYNGFIKEEDLGERVRVLESAKLEQIATKRDSVYLCKVTALSFLGDEVEQQLRLRINDGHYFDLLDEDPQSSVGYMAFDRLFDHLTIKVHHKEKILSPSEQHKVCHLFQESWNKKYRPYDIDEINDHHFNDGLLGVEYDIAKYHSLQHHFPLVYGIGKAGLTSSEPPERHAKAKQLKAYLLFFEQFLANEQSQIANAANFFDIGFHPDAKRTYFPQYPASVPLIETVYPEAGFGTNACVYQTVVWRGQEERRESIDREQLNTLEPNNKRQLLRDWITNADFFRAYLKKTRNGSFPEELKHPTAETQAYLEMLAKLHFPWLSKRFSVNFGSVVVISFAMLLKIEQREVTLSSMAAAFVQHLKKIVRVELGSTTSVAPTTKEVENLLSELLGELGKVNCPSKRDQNYLSNFIKYCAPFVPATDQRRFFERKNRVFDHMLARFGEDLGMAPFLAQTLAQSDSAQDDTAAPDTITDQSITDSLLQAKSNYLNNIATLSANRLKGENFARETGNERKTTAISGLEHVIMAKTGIGLRTSSNDDDTVENNHEEAFYVVDHILLRDFLKEDDLEYGFKFVNAHDEIICETSKNESWCKSEKERDANVRAFFDTLAQPQQLFSYADNGIEVLKSMDIKNPGNERTLASFVPTYNTKGAVLELAQLCDKNNVANSRTRLGELERIRLKGIHKVSRGYFGQRRLIYQVRSQSLQSGNVIQEPVGEDFFNLCVSVVLPSAKGRFKNDQFKSYMKALIMERVPSHIRLNIHFLDDPQMDIFSQKYEAWEMKKVQSQNEEESTPELKFAASEVFMLLLKIQRIEKINDEMARVMQEMDRTEREAEMGYDSVINTLRRSVQEMEQKVNHLKETF